LGELSPQVTERGSLSVLAALGHLSQRERQGVLARSSLPEGEARALARSSLPEGEARGLQGAPK